MNDAYYFISLCHNNDSCVYMTTDNTQDFTTLPPEPGKAIIYFTSKELAEKYIQNITADNKLCVREIHNKEVNRLEWICCYDHNIPFKINGFVGLILLGFILSGSCAFFIWMADRIKHWLEKTDMGTVISIILMLSLIAYGISILLTKKN